MFKVSSQTLDNALQATLMATGFIAVTTVGGAAASRLGFINKYTIVVFGPLVSSIGSVVYLNLIERLPFQFKGSSPRTVRWTFFGIGTAATATITSLALRVFTGNFIPRNKYALCLQALSALAAGRLYTQLVREWAIWALSDNPSKQRIQEVVHGLYKDEASRLWKIYEEFSILDQFGQRDDVTADEVMSNFLLIKPKPWAAGAISEVTFDKLLKSADVKNQLRKLLELTWCDPDRQIQILQKFPLGSEGMRFCPALAEETITHLLGSNPSLWDLAAIQQQEGNVHNRIAGCSNDEIIAFFEHYPHELDEMEIIQCLDLQKVIDLMPALAQKNPAWFKRYFNALFHFQPNKTPFLGQFLVAVPKNNNFKQEDIPKRIREAVACAPMELLSNMLENLSREEVQYQLSFLDQFCQRDDVDAGEACRAFGYVKKNLNRVCDWYMGIISSTTLDKVLTKPTLPLVLFLLDLTYFETHKQVDILCKQLDGDSSPIYELPAHQFLRMEPPHVHYPALAQETIDALLGVNKTPTPLQLVIYANNGRLLYDHWAKVSLDDLLEVDICDGYFKDELPLCIALESIPGEKVTPFYKKLKSKASFCLGIAFNHILNGRTRLDRATVNAWTLKAAPTLKKDHLEMLDYSQNVDARHRLAFMNEIGKRDDITAEELDLLFNLAVDDESFWNCSSSELDQLSDKTLEKFAQILDSSQCPNEAALFMRLLHLMRKQPHRQIQILDRFPLGVDYIYHSSDPVHDHTRFHYPTLHVDTMNNLLKKSQPTVWDLAFCARQGIDVSEQLSKINTEDPTKIANFRDLLPDCLAVPRRCWDNFRCRDSSLLKVVESALPGDEKAEPDKVLELLPPIPPNRPFLYYQTLVQIQMNRFPIDIQRQLTPAGLFYKPADLKYEKINILTPLPRDVFNMICKMLYPADRFSLSRSCARAYNWIRTEQGADIWRDTGSVGAARDLEILSNTIERMDTKKTAHIAHIARITILALALAWPKNYWPRSKEPQWFTDAYRNVQHLG